MSLGAGDQSKLARVLKLARALELAWPSPRDQRVNLAANLGYQNLKREIGACAEADGVDLRRLADRAAHLHDAISLTHFYGCVVPFERLAGRAVRDDEFLISEGDANHAARAQLPLKVIVENMRSAFNVGALFRTCECLGVSEILLCGYTPDPNDAKTARTSMGTAALVPWRRADRAATACAELRAEGYKLVALETSEHAVSLHAAEFGKMPLAFVLGNERFGLEGETLAAVDSVCRIPTLGMKNSLNVGVAFGIAGFEWLRQFELAPR